jgi:tetratricopeptide (TPR) repeat protein
MIGQGLGRLAFAEKLSIPQLEEALENRSIPAYIGVPLLEEKIQMRERMQMAQAGMSPPPQMTIEEEIFARANQAGIDQAPMEQGIDQLPVQMPEYAASGGIVDFAEGGEVIRAFNGLPQDMYQDDMYQDDGPPMRGIIPSVSQAAKGLATGVSDYFQGGIYNDIAQLLRLGYTDAQISQMSPDMRSNIAKQTRDVTPVDVQQDTGIAPAVSAQDVAPTNAPPAPPPPPQDPGIAPVEPVATRSSELSVPGLIGRTEQLYGALYGDQKPKAPDDKSDYLNRAQDFFTQAGVDLNMASKQAEEVARQKADLEGDRREAKKYSVISAGLAILAGDPANSVAENIGKGLGKGMEQYTTAIKDIKKTEREMQSLERSLEVAQNQSRMGLATVAAGDYQAAQKRYDDLNKEMRSNKADLAKALMSDGRAREVVEAQMGGAFEKTFQIELNNLAAQGKDPKDPKIVKQARDAAYKSAGATQLAGQMSTDYRKAADIVAKKLEKLASSESRELRRITKEEGPEAGERYKDTLIEAEAARIRRGEGSGGDGAPAPIGSPMPSKKEELKTGQVYETKQGLGRWDGKQFVSVQ